MSEHPTISVIIPTHNRVELTLRAVESVRAQTLEPDELIVVDDGSASEHFCLLRDRLAAGAIVIRLECSEGPQAARQRGFEAASGDLIATLDSDDVWHPGKLAAQRRALERNADADGVLTWHQWIDEAAGTARQRSFATSETDPTSVNNMSALLVRRQALERAGGFRSAVGDDYRTAEHIEFYVRLRQHARLLVVPSILVSCHEHGEQRVSSRLADGSAAFADLKAVVEDHSPFLRTRPDLGFPLARALLLRAAASGSPSAIREAYAMARSQGVHSAQLWQGLARSIPVLARSLAGAAAS